MFYWLIIVLILAFVEIMTTSLTTIWFVVSGIVSMIVSIFIDSFLIEFGIFVLLGVVLMILTRSYLLKLLDKNKVPTNLDRIIGSYGLVIEKLDKGKGVVKVDGKLWTAYSDCVIDVGKQVKVLSIDSVKIKVEEEK